MFRIAICENTAEECRLLEMQIHMLIPDSVSVSGHTNPFSLVTYIMDEMKGNVDLVMLTVELDKRCTVNIAESILLAYPHIRFIFMGRNLNYIQEIFRVDPIFFLVKPYQKKYLEDALFKAKRLVDEAQKEYLILKAKYGRGGIVTVSLRDIYYISSNKRIVEVYCEKDMHEAYMKLDELEEKLPDTFLRCHQSYVVNLDKVMEVGKDTIRLFDGSEIPISRARKNQVMECYQKYTNIEGIGS